MAPLRASLFILLYSFGTDAAVLSQGKARGQTLKAWPMPASSYKYNGSPDLQTAGQPSLMRTARNALESSGSAVISHSSVLLIASAVAIIALVFFRLVQRCPLHDDIKRSRRSTARRGKDDAAPPAPSGQSKEQEAEGAHRLLWHLKEERPLHASKATGMKAIVEHNLLAYIHKYFEYNCGAMKELKQALDQRCLGESPIDCWWSWAHPNPLSFPMSELMSQFQCDGLVDWSKIPSTVLAHTYLQIIVTSGLGAYSMLHEGDGDWLESLHRDVFCDWSLRGLKHFFFSKVDTLLVGCIGRKRVILLPPQAVAGVAKTAEIDWDLCDVNMQKIRRMDLKEGWAALEEHAVNAGGAAVTICPDTYCHIPTDWWHIVRPLDDLTVVLSPSFLSGRWAGLEG